MLFAYPSLLLFVLKSRNIVSKKNAAAYQVSRSAVKKIQKEKSGIDNIREIIPAIAANLGFSFNIKINKTTRKTVSCIFMPYYL